MKQTKKNVLIVVAHSDDESFGCGGLLKSLSEKKYKLYAISFTDGVGSRGKRTEKDIEERKKHSIKASRILGFRWLAQYNFPDNQLDKITLLEIVKIIEKHKKILNPEIVITHNFYDLNIDHRIIAEATLTAFRPEPKSKCKEIITFEIPSSTDYRMLKRSKNFVPNYFVNIQKYLNSKIKAIKSYKNELKKPPHSRSIEGIKI